ncbi:MAG TPA: peptide chain release factor 2 [Polyangia bacterium]|nr:peptide chain release factor 2 [Polyangia bacterium]
MEIGPLRERLSKLESRLEILRGHFDIAGKRLRIAELDDQSSAPEFWNEAEKAKVLMREQGQLKGVVEGFDAQMKATEDAKLFIEMATEAKDDDAAREADGTLTASEAAVTKMEFARMLSGPYDQNGALVSINAGAGGTESQDWAQMLLRMYTRWAERRGFKIESLDLQAGDEAGIKSATILINGEWAYGWLRAEAGVHRLVRISPFDSAKRRHTSFASAFIYPDIDETIKIEIDEKDLRVDVMRSGGAGGQHVNKTESAVRLTHIPTGIAVHSDQERSQHKNRAVAMRILKAKLFEVEQKKQEEKMGNIHAQKKAIEWGSQIRSYVLAPYKMVNDHRTGIKDSDVDGALDGDLDRFMIARLLQLAGDPSAAPLPPAGGTDEDDI